MKRMYGICARGAITTAVALVLGCASSSNTSSNDAPQAVAPAPSAPRTGGSALSYGTVTSRVEKGKTTQADLIEMFGGPNISTMDADGLETWVYERSSSDTDMDANANAKNLDAFFGVGVFAGGVGAGAGGAAGTRNSNSRSHASSSTRSLTVIVKFAKDKTVKDYTARSSQF
jgi:hypothetical protein